MGIRIMITGASGFVGEGVLLICLANPDVSEVLMVNRKHIGLSHPKLKELVVPDFMELASFSGQLTGYDACFYCAGISVSGLSEAAYTRITYDTTLHFATVLLKISPGMVFNFVSGSSTDSTEKGKVMWARVKGKTENALLKLGFKQVYNFRPGGMIPVPGQQHVKPLYGFIVKVMSYIIPKRVSTLRAVGLAMINAVLAGYTKHTLEVADIIELAKNKP
jgi:uncharacterized protein YbjT (DUF2867 family)